MRWWTRFKKWLWWKTCPTMTIVVRCGKKTKGRFSTTKQFVFHERPMTVITLDCHFKFDRDYEVHFGDKTLSKAEILAAIDSVTEAETIEETTKRLQGDIQGVKSYLDGEKPE